jgi:hypothetical protein
MKLLISAIFLFISLSLQARVQPEEGLWDNPDAQGRGLTIELQNGVLVATYFGYDQDGNAQWWQGVGFEDPESTWSGSFNAFRDGQCNSCPFQQSEIDSDNDIGNFSLTFESSSRAVLNWDGGTEIIEKNYYFFNQPLDFFFGVWTMNGFTVSPTGDYGIAVNGAVLRIDQYVTIDDVQYAAGNYSGLVGDSIPVLARSLGEINNIGPLLVSGDGVIIAWPSDSTGQNIVLFEVVINENKMEGLMTVYPADTPPVSYNGYLRAAGAKYIDRYEKEYLFGVPTNPVKNSENSGFQKLHESISNYMRNK